MASLESSGNHKAVSVQRLLNVSTLIPYPALKNMFMKKKKQMRMNENSCNKVKKQLLIPSSRPQPPPHQTIRWNQTEMEVIRPGRYTPAS